MNKKGLLSYTSVLQNTSIGKTKRAPTTISAIRQLVKADGIWAIEPPTT